ncbi:hypothetical protein EIP86_002641 [Pleurotus ostreatoroseus]|nr:hypothetical protein EIP86_002641 [Pleurotus ostreatoroseus]
MPVPITLTLNATLLAVVVYVSIKVISFRRTQKLMPPGPPGIPFLGNVLQVPKEQAFRQFTEWGDIYDGESNGVQCMKS